MVLRKKLYDVFNKYGIEIIVLMKAEDVQVSENVGAGSLKLSICNLEEVAKLQGNLVNRKLRVTIEL